MWFVVYKNYSNSKIVWDGPFESKESAELFARNRMRGKFLVMKKG